LPESERENGPVRLGRRRLRNASSLRAAQPRDRSEPYARSLSRRGAGDAGPDRRPHRLFVLHHPKRRGAGQPRRRQGHRRDGGKARADHSRCGDDRRARLAGGRGERLERVFLPKGPPRADRAQAQQGDERHPRRPGHPPAAGGTRPRDRGARAPHAGISREISAGRDRALGEAHPRRRHQRGLKSALFGNTITRKHKQASAKLSAREDSMLRAKAAAVAFLLAPLATASAQDWPTRAVTMVVPYAAGGPVDTLGRIVAARLSEILGQQVVVENVAGAGGMTGWGRVAKAPPDGYTVLLSGSAVLAINQTLYKKPLYNAVTDFEHVALFSDSARVLITRKDLPVNTLAEFVAYAKANQGKMQYGSAGAGSGMHVCAVLLDAAMGTKITHVPYRGSAPAMQDFIGGRIDFVAEQISTALPQIQGGTVKAIATLGLDRAPGLEQLPSAQELGLAGLDCGSWGSLSFPKGTPDEIVQRLAKATNEAVETPAVRERFKSIGVTIPAAERRTPEYLAKFVVSEIARSAGPNTASGASAD